ncbi:hypothetical protein [Pseudoalteromonas luteoviolacea]|uniref:Uncharacterized protein n=1 Tax=Pseudoalteromonas luteoviolacea DSM 6061 TaxID=1365250 RepID=A0A166XGW7_9GAMM|nr:hypothetical protein [Pseudoalteromonas luteoviolacea]KZN40303.1 hypothetical protein N475_12620 [Pseudoalteromonas luteoviolacea DSM 6061]MBE0387917.1 hypothetical protein [Pseudoalteromonas luteoviolacea DSM 6061]
MNELELSDSLQDLCDILESFFGRGVRDVSGLKRAISRLRTRARNPKQKNYPLNINIARLVFDVPNTHKHTLPVGITESTLSVSIKMGFRTSTVSFDAISELNIDFEVSSYNSEGNTVKSAWHLDYHNVVGNEHFSHPQFHFQFGGKKLRESLQESNSHLNTGELLLMESPRLMHPPLDPVLAIDFIFGNFLGENAWKALRNKKPFGKIHKLSKDMFWKPYYSGISDYLLNPSAKTSLGLHP